mgnify:CR=1 FL=1|tara:strand:+ start:579 stop:1388 length:810 start_codon:yes stop_codon:yes gene_type:complete
MNKNKKRTTPIDSLLKEALHQNLNSFINVAIDTEVQEFLITNRNKRIDNKLAIVRNGYLPERTLKSSFGDISIKIPKIRDRTKQGIKFNSKIILPYRKHIHPRYEHIRGYLIHSLITGQTKQLMSKLFSRTIQELPDSFWPQITSKWQKLYYRGMKTDLNQYRYPVLYASSFKYKVTVSQNTHLLFILGMQQSGQMDLLGASSSYNNSNIHWRNLFNQIEKSGLTIPPHTIVTTPNTHINQFIYTKWPNTAYKTQSENYAHSNDQLITA